MSIIGTRPPLISETNFYELHHRARLAIKPGITGMWQVSGRSDITDFEEVVRLDKEYITDKKGYKIYLFGAKEEVVTKVKKIFEDKYPNIQIVGYKNGYFTEKDEPEIVKNMAESGADMMFVAFSSPNPYGDGFACKRIANILEEKL